MLLPDRLRNLFPRNTSCVELTSGGALVISAIMMVFYGNVFIGGDYKYLTDRVEVWIILIFFLGCLQLASVIFDPELVVLRILCAWAVGYFLIWDASSYASIVELTEEGSIHVDGIVKFILGVSNMYAFVLQMAQVRDKWKE
jgi:hypothetical protein